MSAVGLNEFEVVRLAEGCVCRDDYFPRALVIIDADVIVEGGAERSEFDAEVARLRRDCFDWRWRLWFAFSACRSWSCEVTC